MRDEHEVVAVGEAVRHFLAFTRRTLRNLFLDEVFDMVTVIKVLKAMFEAAQKGSVEAGVLDGIHDQLEVVLFHD
jgi:hypothetical protein